MELIFSSLKGFESFTKAFHTGKKFRSGAALTSVQFNSKQSSPVGNVLDTSHIVSYAVTVSKRTAKRAVLRNRIKRLMRESLRKELSDLFHQDQIVISTFIWIWRSAPKKPGQIHLNDVSKELRLIIDDIKFYHLKIQKSKY
ncbi:MAG: ribonuclease P protein component [Candidatus Kapabacteria bacterium]|nr:ribonuclease P protein component [Candidatus Kapabacteria bacterium]